MGFVYKYIKPTKKMCLEIAYALGLNCKCIQTIHVIIYEKKKHIILLFCLLSIIHVL